MCGKFTAQMTWGEYCARAGLGSDSAPPPPDAMRDDKVLGTFTPMSTVPVLHLGPVRQRRITPMRWGWYDHRSGNPRKFSHLHARAESIDSTMTWSSAFQSQRGVVLCRSFNIGEALPNGKIKQWVCARADGAVMALAVIFNMWELVQGPLRAFVMITTASCAPLNTRDDRMPAILANETEVATWLGEKGAGTAELNALLRSYEGALVMREQDSVNQKQEAPPEKPRRSSQSSLF